MAPDPQLCTVGTKTWAENERTTSIVFVNTINQHVTNVQEDFETKAHSQKAYAVSQDVPWSEAEFRNDKSIVYLRYAQHSISIFTMNLGMSCTLPPTPRDTSISTQVCMQISASLAIFSTDFAELRGQICSLRLLSMVTGVQVDNFEIVSLAEKGPAVMRLFLFHIHIVNLNTSYQNRHVIRLDMHLSNPLSSICLCLQAMFLQLIETWTDFLSGNKIAILGATVHFAIKTRSWRLLDVDRNAIVAMPQRCSHDRNWNQTYKFFVRFQDIINNKDSMLDFSSNKGLFSRMCVVSARYNQAVNFSRNEANTLLALDQLLASPLRSASRDSLASGGPTPIEIRQPYSHESEAIMLYR